MERKVGSSTDYEDSADNSHTMWVTGEISTSTARWNESDLDVDLQSDVELARATSLMPAVLDATVKV
jgi:hypothetical protein